MRRRGFSLGVCTLLAICLVLAGAEEDETRSDEPVLVTCGSVIKLESEATRHYLHSHEVSYGYGRGSGQQSVTGFPERDSANSLWAVRAADCRQGEPIKNGQEVRLQHTVTRRWLHSHQFASPLSNNQEVSACGDDAASDANDIWRVEWDGSEAAWTRDAPVRLLHKATSAYLSNHAVKYQRPIPGHTEVMGLKTRAAPKATWRATEGVYFAPRDPNTA